MGTIQTIWPAARFARILAITVLIGLAVNPASRPPTAAASAAAPATVPAAMALDNVAITLSTPFLAGTQFTTAAPGNASQVATAAAWHPFRELTITAVPFGTRPGTEALPVAQAGGAPGYIAALRQLRQAEGGTLFGGPTANLFGQRVTGQAALVRLNVDGPVAKPVLVVEWVVEAGPRLWIVRASQEQTAPDSASAAPTAMGALGQLVVASTTLANPTTVGGGAGQPREPVLTSAPAAGDLPVPAWWKGDCDRNNGTYVETNGISSHRLGAVYLGMPACGPRPYADNVQDVLVRFFPGAWGEFEWECVELSMRYMYLAYGVHPYSANGNMVVWHYSSAADGGSLIAISNATTNDAPQPGDVLSYGSTAGVGHTSVVMSTTVDATGNGSLLVIEENNAPNGASTLGIANWVVQGNAGAVSGWLHKPTWVLTDTLWIPLMLQNFAAAP